MASLGFCLMYLGIPLFPSASFLKYDAGDVPVILMAFAAGPAAGVTVAALKCLLFLVLQGGVEAYVGAPLSFAWGAVFAWTAGTIYRRQKTRRQAIGALLVGSLMASASLVGLNAWILPWYLALVTQGPPRPVPPSLLLGVILPFNLLKGALSSLLCFAIYKRLSPLLKDESQVPPN